MRTRRLTTTILAAALAALALAPAAPAAVTVGHSGWDWGTPLPQGNAIRALDFAGARGYAAGDFGTLLRTDDAGATWRGLATGIVSDLARLRVLGADTVIVGGGCTVRRSDDGGATFSRLPFTPSDNRCAAGVASFSFSTAAIGYLVLTDGTVLRTADGGKTFSRKTAVPGTEAARGSATPTDIFFTGDDTGFATTSSPAAGKIYRTTDGGNSWMPVAEAGKGFNGLAFVGTTGYAVGQARTLFKSSDGGATWAAKTVEPSADLTSIRCSTAAVCLLATAKGDQLLRTTDGGDTITAVTPATEPIFAAAFSSATRVVAGGEGGTTVVSDDAGVTFARVGGQVPGRFSRLRATSAGAAYAPGDNGALARTTDGGRTWTALGVSTSEDVVDVAFPTTEIGFALDSAGTLLRTDNGGGSWSVLNTGTAAKPPAVLALDKDRVLLIGPTGLRRSTDGGGSFDAIRGKLVNKSALQDADRAGSAIFAWGPKAIIRSTDGGKTWRKVGRPSKRPLIGVDFVSAKLGYALNVENKLWQTRDGGRRWLELAAVGTDNGIGLAFSSATRGYLVVNNTALGLARGSGHEDDNDPGGVLLRTTDGGKSWHPQLIARDPIAERGIVAPGGATDYALAGESQLFSTASGGDAGEASTLTITTKSRRLRRAAKIKVTGRLAPAGGRELVMVSMRPGGGQFWQTKTVEVAANGSFTTTWNVPKSGAVFVAQWRGDDERAGDGSTLLAVDVGRRR